MREIALASQRKNKEIIEYLFEDIKKNGNFNNAIITNYCDNNFSYLLFACDDEKVLSCEDSIRQSIINYIEQIYKVNFFKKLIKNPIKDSLAYNAYINVLSQFDRGTDENALNKLMLLNQTFFVDSFIEFRLSPLKAHWKNMAELSGDNIGMFNSSTFQDVIRFLINTMDSTVYKIKVICNKNKFSIFNMKNKNSKIKKIADCTTTTDLVNNVLINCPNYIDVYLDSQIKNDAVTFLSGIYANRLKIYAKN